MGLNEELNKTPPTNEWSSSPNSGTQSGWTPEASTSMGWTENTLEYYAEINPTRIKFGYEILCTLRFKTVWEIIQCSLTSKGYEGFGPADLYIVYDAKILKIEEILRNLLLHNFALLTRIFITVPTQNDELLKLDCTVNNVSLCIQ